MNKILINLFVPSINEKFDVLVLENKKLSEIKQLIVEGIVNLTNDNLKNADKLILCNQETGVMYNLEHTVKENLITDGTKLILF